MKEVNYKNFGVIGYSDYNNYNQISLSGLGFEGSYFAPNKEGMNLPYWKIVGFEPDCFIVDRLENNSELIRKISEKSERVSEERNNFEKFLSYF
jgi:hypothetical protein